MKKASPSLGDIHVDVDIVAQAKTYEENGAVMISVLTDEVFFKGSIEFLREISSQVRIPTLNSGLDSFWSGQSANFNLCQSATPLLFQPHCLPS